MKLIKFFKYSYNKKKEVILNRINLFYILPVIYFNRYTINFVPDSFKKNKYSYFKFLHSKFIKNNKLNNKGDVARLYTFILNIDYILKERGIEGDFAELGVYQGSTAQILAFFAKEFNRKCYLFDTFEGFNEKDLIGSDSIYDKSQFSNTSIEQVKNLIGIEAVDRCIFIKGHFPESIPKELYNKKFSIVSIDCDLYVPMNEALKFFFPLMSHGGIFLLHDYSSCEWEGAKKAIDEFCQKENQYLVLVPDKSGTAILVVNKSQKK